MLSFVFWIFAVICCYGCNLDRNFHVRDMVAIFPYLLICNVGQFVMELLSFCDASNIWFRLMPTSVYVALGCSYNVCGREGV